MRYVTPEQAADHLRLEDPTDPDLVAKITQASAIVAGYLDTNAPAEADASPIVQAGTLLMLGYLYRYRDSAPDYSAHSLPAPVTAVLYPLRGPTYA